MENIVDFSNYKLQRKNNGLSKLSEAQMAQQILKKLNYSDKNIAIPIVKIAKSYGLKVYHEDFCESGESRIVGKLLIGDISKYDSGQVILVNRNEHIFTQRVVVATMLGSYVSYLIDRVVDQQNVHPEDLSTSTLTYKEIYDKHEKFVLNILAPDNIFINQYNIAVDSGLPSIGVTSYLSRFFEAPEDFVYEKVKSSTRM